MLTPAGGAALVAGDVPHTVVGDEDARSGLLFGLDHRAERRDRGR